MKVVAIVQARMGSTRLPGKVLRVLCGKPMIGHVLDRARAIEDVDQVQVAVPEGPADDLLFSYLSSQLGVGVTRGSESDVLTRYLKAATETSADAVVRITADCPLLSPTLAGRVVKRFLEHRSDVDYASNILKRTFPRGLDTEVISFSALEEAYREAVSPSDREHVTPFIWRQPQRFRLHSVTNDEDQSGHRWTVDTEEDFELVSRIYAELYREGSLFEYEEILSCLDRHPEWATINRDVQQKAIT